MDNFLKDYPLVIEFPVRWGDMDAFQHINNVLYFRYFESARIAYFEKLRLDEIMKKTGIGPILKSTQCKFKIPLTYPDTVAVGTKLISLEADRFTMQYVVVSQHHQGIAAEGEGLVVSYDYNKKEKAPFPEEVQQRIVELEKGRFQSQRA